MPWTERQRRLLDAMGLRLFTPPVADRAASSSEATAPADDRPSAGEPAHGAPSSASRQTATSPSAAGASPAGPPVARPAEPGARPATDVESMDWAALRAAVAGCRACALCESRRQTVFGIGHARAHWMIVGEAPGEQEDATGEPFVGPAGRLLDNMLRPLGLGRGDGPPERQVFIANTLKCRPPRNRNPAPAEMACCEPYLRRQIALVQPRVILAMGAFAVQSLLRADTPIGRLRGRVHHTEGVPVVVTYHPAYLLRNPADKARAWDDLCLAAEVAERSADASPAGSPAGDR